MEYDINIIKDLQQYDIELSDQELHAQRLPDGDSLTSWQTPLSVQKPAVTKKKKSKRSDYQLWNDNRRHTCSYSDGVWDDSIEKYSYKYIPNNGCYRQLKAQLSISTKQNISQKRPSSPSGGGTTSGVVYGAEYRRLQREISMDLQKEFRSLLESNKKYFRLLNESPSAVVDYLEDEEDYKDKMAASITKPTTVGTSGGSSNPLPTAQPSNKSRSTLPTYQESPSVLPVVQSNALLPNSNPILPNIQTSSTLPPVQSVLTLAQARTRPLETQSALAASTNLEDLIIKKRCSTNLEQITSDFIATNGGHEPPPIRYEKLSHKHSILPSTSRIYVNTDDVEDLANKTFSNRKGEKNIEKKFKQLKPIEKANPSLREVFDNSKAMIEMMKLNSSYNTDVTIGLSRVMNSKLSSSNLVATDSLMVSKPKVMSKNPFGTTATTQNTGYKVTKLGETRPKLPVLRTIDEQLKNTYQSLLPSVSGKRITSKLGSLR